MGLLQNAKHPNVIVSPLTVVPEIVAVVVEEAVCVSISAVVVRSLAQQVKPCGAVTPGVMTTVHTPLVPLANDPAVLPPTVEVAEHAVSIVNFVPVMIFTGAELVCVEAIVLGTIACPAMAATTLVALTGVATEIAPELLAMVVPSGFTPPRVVLVATGKV